MSIINKKLEKYIPLINFMGLVFGNNFEIILHDISNLESSVIAIVNSHISGRSIGSSITDFAMKIILDKEYLNNDYIVNYEGRTKDGRSLVSSTFFIKEKNKLIGMLCVNHDVHDLVEANKSISNLMKAFSLVDPPSSEFSYSENLDDSVKSLSSNIIQSTFNQFGIPPERMSSDEKIELVRQLDHQYVFSTKGSVTQVANYFNTSESTIYRYINKSRK